jgi:protein-tyrosine phosphatase
MFTFRPGRPSVSVVLPGLLVGAYPAPHDATWLAETHGIGAVVSLQDDADLAAKRLLLADLERAYRTAGIDFERYPVPDGDEDRLVHVLPDVVARVAAHRAAAHAVLVHCNAGMNRAPTALNPPTPLC